MILVLGVFAVPFVWFGLGFVSFCVNFGSWRKNPIIPFINDGSVGTGNWDLILELAIALLSGPIVSGIYIWRWWRHGAAIGFEVPSLEKFKNLTAA